MGNSTLGCDLLFFPMHAQRMCQAVPQFPLAARHCLSVTWPQHSSRTCRARPTCKPWVLVVAEAAKGRLLQVLAPARSLPRGRCAPARLCIESKMTPRCCSLPARGVQPCAAQPLPRQLGDASWALWLSENKPGHASPFEVLGLLLGQSSALPTYLGSPLLDPPR